MKTRTSDTVVKFVVGFIVLVVLCVFVVNSTYHEWHPVGPNVKFGTLIEEEKKEDGSESRPYAKKSFTWRSNEITEDTITWTFIEGDNNLITATATSIDFGPDSNAWVRFDWCSRHGEVRAVRVE